MNQKNYFIVTALVFLLVSLLHLARVFLGWEASIGGWMVPQWVSGVALAVALFLAYSGLTLNKQVQ